MRGRSQDLTPPQVGHHSRCSQAGQETARPKPQRPQPSVRTNFLSAKPFVLSLSLSTSTQMCRSHLAGKGVTSEAVCLPKVMQASWEAPTHMQPVRPNRNRANRVWDGEEGTVPKKTVPLSLGPSLQHNRIIDRSPNPRASRIRASTHTGAGPGRRGKDKNGSTHL